MNPHSEHVFVFFLRMKANIDFMFAESLLSNCLTTNAEAISCTTQSLFIK